MTVTTDKESTMFDDWAQPVTSKRWERACGIYPYSPEQIAEIEAPR